MPHVSMLTPHISLHPAEPTDTARYYSLSNTLHVHVISPVAVCRGHAHAPERSHAQSCMRQLYQMRTYSRPAEDQAW